MGGSAGSPREWLQLVSMMGSENNREVSRGSSFPAEEKQGISNLFHSIVA